MTFGQRGLNLHPLGGSMRSGTFPRIDSSRTLGFLTSGMHLINSLVYGCNGFRKSSLVDATSTMLPAYITAILSAVSAAIERSCVTSNVDASMVSLRLIRRLSTWAWMVTSKAVVISSAIKRDGRLANAIAIMHR